MDEQLRQQVAQVVALALAEDVGMGDLTSLATVSPQTVYEGRLIAKTDGVVAGLAVAQAVFHHVDPQIAFQPCVADGQAVTRAELVGVVRGQGQSLLTAERTALNFLQRMSGIASLTRQYVDAVRGTKAVILDTRKTVPGLRHLDKWAVRLGGGQNHRVGLYDMALIKDNHIVAAGGITAAVNKVRAFDTEQRPIEVEVKNMAELDEALTLNLTRIMLDNMSLSDMRQAVELTAGRTPLEASGNVNLSTVADIAATGVDFISSGQLTHSVTALDISFLL